MASVGSMDLDNCTSGLQKDDEYDKEVLCLDWKLYEGHIIKFVNPRRMPRLQ